MQIDRNVRTTIPAVHIMKQEESFVITVQSRDGSTISYRLTVEEAECIAQYILGDTSNHLEDR